jgi:serine protease Do
MELTPQPPQPRGAAPTPAPVVDRPEYGPFQAAALEADRVPIRRRRRSPSPVKFALTILLMWLSVAAVAVAVFYLFPPFMQRRSYHEVLGASQAAQEVLEEADVVDRMGHYRRLVVHKVKPSVVSIRAIGRRDGTPAGAEKESSASGVVISNEGHILTNHHVIKGARTVRVRLIGGPQYLAERIVGTDEKTDLAVLKISADVPLVPIEWGDSDTVEVGDSVLAVGNPYGLEATVTGGIISGTKRSGIFRRERPDAYEAFLQTDAAINPGNSGGPLLNLEGEVIGINTAILSPTGGFQGIGLAVPANLARNITRQLVTTGRVVRGYLGVGIQDLDLGLARNFGLDSTDGVLINQVGHYTPAAKAGLAVEDIVLKIDGKPMPNADALRNTVAQLVPGRAATFSIWRDRKEQQITVTIEQQPADMDAAVRDGPIEDYWGMKLSTVTPAVARRLRLSLQSGALVTSVARGTYAWESGLRRGQVITRFDQTDVTDRDQLRKLLQAIDPKVGATLKVALPTDHKLTILLRAQ